MKKQSISAAVFSVLIALLLAATAWGWVSGRRVQSAVGSNTNPPFENKLAVEVVRPISIFDVSKASSVYHQVPVYTFDGRKVDLDARHQPLLFVAYWCPHCQRTLALLNRNQAVLGRKPILVSMGFAQGTTLQQATQIENAEVKLLGLHGFTIDYLLNEDPNRYVPQTYPTLVFNAPRTGLMSLHSEHTLAVWKRALQ